MVNFHGGGFDSERMLHLRAHTFAPVTTDLPAEYDIPGRICSMCLKTSLRDIQADRANLCHGRLLQVVHLHLHFGTSMPSGGVHPVPSRRLVRSEPKLTGRASPLGATSVHLVPRAP